MSKIIKTVGRGENKINGLDYETHYSQCTKPRNSTDTSMNCLVDIPIILLLFKLLLRCNALPSTYNSNGFTVDSNMWRYQTSSYAG